MRTWLTRFGGVVRRATVVTGSTGVAVAHGHVVLAYETGLVTPGQPARPQPPSGGP
jgi:hypothetical protein